MRRYSEAVQADVRKWTSPPNRQDVPQISRELGIHRSTLYQWRSNWRLQGEVVRESEKIQIAGVLEINSQWCLKQLGLFVEQVNRCRQTAQDASANVVLTMAEQKELEKLPAQDQREIKALIKELQRKEKAMAELAALLVLQRSRCLNISAFCREAIAEKLERLEALK